MADIGIVWFRRDLRLSDNPALAAALSRHDRVLPIYIHDPRGEAPWAPGAASNWWLHHALSDLDSQLDGGLLICRGAADEVLSRLLGETQAGAVYWNRVYEPAAIERDRSLKASLTRAGFAVRSHNASLLYEPWELEKKSGGAFRVFTPFWKTLRARGLPDPVRHQPPGPGDLQAPAGLGGVALDGLGLRPKIPWDTGIAAHWTPTRAGGEGRLEEFLTVGLEHYAGGRDHPAEDHVSALSPYLHFGQLGVREVAAACGRVGGVAEDYLRELAWREFAHHLLYHFPQTPDEPLDARFAEFPWRDDPAAMEAWQCGETGVPLVDAGMRELWTTGWMHNRVRMVVASFLTKNLLLRWQAGAAWFWDTLVDADLANNTLGWQWTAGCGADAAPYFRVFNPVRQGERFDSAGRYVRRWIPELAGLPDKWVHQPWAAPDAVLAEAGISLGRDYPRPIVDLAASRKRALAAWDSVK